MQTLGRLMDAVLVRPSAGFHAKAVVADPMGGSSRGVIMTANLTREALDRNEDLFIGLDAAGAAEAGLVMIRTLGAGHARAGRRRSAQLRVPWQG